MYFKDILFFVLLITSYSLHAQSIQQRDTVESVDYDSLKNQDQVYTFAGVMPQFPGGDTGFAAYISKNLKYPKEAVEQRIEGTVYIAFVVDTLGNVIDVKVARSVHPLLDKAALDVIAASPRWKPGQLDDGIPIKIKKIQTIKFTLK